MTDELESYRGRHGLKNVATSPVATKIAKFCRDKRP